MQFTEPFPHSIGENAFPEDLYKRMLLNLPEWKDMIPGPADPYLRRHLKQGMGGPVWEEAWKYLENKYPGEKLQMGLYKTLPGFYLLPHTDKNIKNETTVYYITDKINSEGGTALFKSIFDLSDPCCQSWPFEYFETPKIVPCIPNGWMTFEVSDISFHGVLPQTNERWIIYLTRYHAT